MEYKVGQKIWFVPREERLGQHAPVEYQVFAVGRKWVSIGRDRPTYRVEVGKVEVDGGNYSSPGTLYPSQEVYAEYRALIFAALQYKKVPPGVSVDDIKQARALLKL